MNTRKIYLAGPLFTKAERDFIADLAFKIRGEWQKQDNLREQAEKDRKITVKKKSEIRKKLEKRQLFVPQEFCAEFDEKIRNAKTDDDRKRVFRDIRRACLKYLKEADLIVALIDGPDIDSGTAYECGYASAMNKPIVALRTDMRPAENGVGNCMITGEINVFTNFDELLVFIKHMTRDI